MDKLFLLVLNMSITGTFVVAVICFARLTLNKAPKIITYCLWAVAWLRFVLPLSIESMFSLIPFRAQTIPPDIAAQSVPRIDSGIPILNDAVSYILPLPPANTVASVNPLQVWTSIGSWIWFACAAVMLIFGVASYFRLKYRLGSAIRVEGNIYETDCIQSPFVSGIFKPRIYVPLGISGQEREYIILHEKTHIRRHDHIVKFAVYIVLCLHWFNPLAWVAFLLMGVDMEMSCDERVLKELGGEIKKGYSMSLLSLSAGWRIVSGSPLAFVEDGVKKRIKNVLKFRKPSRIAVALAIAFVAVLSLGLVANRAGTDDLHLRDTYATGVETVNIESDNGFAPVYMNSGSSADAEKTYVIDDWYNNEDGKLSTFELGLDGENSEGELTVRSGDILVVGDRRYIVAAQSLTLSVYPQPSLDQAIRWWVDYLDSWSQSGEITLIR